MTRRGLHGFEMVRRFVSAGLLSLGLLMSAAVAARAQVSGTWTTTGSLNVARCAHTATLLPNGLVLIAGGEGTNSQALSSAELFEPATGKWTLTGSMSTPRFYHTATLLPDGQVLVAGGLNSTFLDNAELYNPSTGHWSYRRTMNGPLTQPRPAESASPQVRRAHLMVVYPASHACGNASFHRSSMRTTDYTRVVASLDRKCLGLAVQSPWGRHGPKA